MCECIPRKTQMHVYHMKIVRFRLYIRMINCFIDSMFLCSILNFHHLITFLTQSETSVQAFSCAVYYKFNDNKVELDRITV